MAKTLFKIESDGDNVHVKTEGNIQQMTFSIAATMQADSLIAAIIMDAVEQYVNNENEILNIEKCTIT